jgi:hypothetical protein
MRSSWRFQETVLIDQNPEASRPLSLREHAIAALRVTLQPTREQYAIVFLAYLREEFGLLHCSE